MKTKSLKDAPSKLYGTYPQKQEGLYMQRIPVFAGRITLEQFQRVAELAVEYTHNTPLHLTTRQDIELHNIPEEDTLTVLTQLHEAGLDTYGAGGDSIRNITVSSGCEFDPNTLDVIFLADAVRRFMLELAQSYRLPRKFKISFSGCLKKCGKPYVNDLGFVALRDDKLLVIGAGSLGPIPQTGIVLHEKLDVQEVLPFSVAALELFNDLGNRENRRKARLRHIRQWLGDEVFLRELHKRFDRAKQQRNWPKILVRRASNWTPRQAILQLPNGNIDPADALDLTNAAKSAQAQLRINLMHGLELYGNQPVHLPEALKPLTLLPCVIACPGAETCKNGIAHTQQIAEQIRKLGKPILNGKIVAISGCPNNCVHSVIADIGLVGRMKTMEGKRTECFDILLGGGNGQTDKLAEKAGTLPADQIPDWLRQNK